MKKLINGKVFLILFLFLGALAYYIFQSGNEKTPTTEPPEDHRYTNLEAFGKLYGYVRYYHPSDEAVNTNWERFAIYGVSKVKKAKNEQELKTILEELFLPIAPTMRIYFDGEKPKKTRTESNNARVVAWQHFGPAGEDQSLYKSQRTFAKYSNGKYALEDHLFEAFPKINDVIKEKISKELVCSIPLVLKYEKASTVGNDKTSRENFKKLTQHLKNLDPNLSSEDEDVRYAGMIVTWNIYNHFYPYFDVTNSDWSNQLLPALKDTTRDQSRNDYISTIYRLMEKTKDGHAGGFIFNNRNFGPNRSIAMDLIDNQLVVTASRIPDELKPGDVILAFNGKDSIEMVEEMEKLIPGSPQWKKYLATTMFLLHNNNSYELKIKRENRIINYTFDGHNAFADEFNRDEPFKEIEKGIYYINLNRDIEHKVAEQLEELSRAKGIIFDLRGYPYSYDFMLELVGHLTEQPVKGPIGRIMQTIYPNQKRATYYEYRDEIQPVAPIFQGKAVFLSYSGSSSQPEYFLSYIKDNHLGEIVGQPTAGTDGTIQTFNITGNLQGTFTGMVYLNADRSQTHLIGIHPTVPIERTIEAVKNGEDEYITKALEIINK